MCTVSGGVKDDLQSYIPMVCTNSPANGTQCTCCVLFKIWLVTRQAFCELHCVRVAISNRPERVSEKWWQQRVDEELNKISKMLEGSSPNIKTAS